MFPPSVAIYTPYKDKMKIFQHLVFPEMWHLIDLLSLLIYSGRNASIWKKWSRPSFYTTVALFTFEDLFLIFNYVSVHGGLGYARVNTDACRSRLRFPIPCSWSNRWLWMALCGYWELYLDPLQKQYVLLIPEPSLQIPSFCLAHRFIMFYPQEQKCMILQCNYWGCHKARL